MDATYGDQFRGKFVPDSTPQQQWWPQFLELGTGHGTSWVAILKLKLHARNMIQWCHIRAQMPQFVPTPYTTIKMVVPRRKK